MNNNSKIAHRYNNLLSENQNKLEKNFKSSHFINKEEKHSPKWRANKVSGNFFGEFIGMFPGKDISSWEMVCIE